MSQPTPPSDRTRVLDRALKALDALQSRLDMVERDRREPIAIVGLACRFPGAPSADAYWRLLEDGREAVTEVPGDRWARNAYDDADPAAAGKMQKPFGGFLDRVDLFDAAFFGISGREAETMDPQQRLLLEVSWEALESANIPPPTLRGSATGVYVGITTNDYARLALHDRSAGFDVYTATGGALNVAAGRIAYTLGLHGPAMAVDTACSSSLVAVHLACQGLRARECDTALAGGVNVLLTPEPFVCFAKWGMMAPDGRCKAFDARADGFVRAEGCGIVVLRRLSDAVAAGDHVLALVRGTAVNQDGASSGLTVPNGPAQQAVVRRALEAAGLGSEAVDYVEAHGTGTALGDPIELEALAEALCRNRTRPLRVGSVKTNIGHTESASGIAGVIKVVLSLQRDTIPAHLHFSQLNPRISLRGAPIEVPVAAVPWLRGAALRVAGVSSFGFSGTNAHVILEEAPAPGVASSGPQERSAHLLVLSARSDAALRELAAAYADRLEEAVDLPDVCHAASTGRAAFEERLAVVARSQKEAAVALRAGTGTPPPAFVHRHRAQGTPRVAFLFTGQGSQYVGMGRALYETEPVYRAAFARCAEVLRQLCAEPIAQVVGYDDAGSVPGLVNETEYTQPALFAVEYALAALWRSWGIEPVAVLGHSVGEFVAACVAGAIDLEDALALVANRARLMQTLTPPGSMAAVLADEARVRLAVATHRATVSIAAVNSPRHTVISGAPHDVDAVVRHLAAESIEARPLTVSRAFHSPLVEPMLDEFERAARGVRVRAPSIDMVSNVTASLVDDTAPLDAAYWRRHAREAVRFADSVRALHTRGVDTFLEIGPAPVLTGMGRQCVNDPTVSWLMSMRRDEDVWPQILSSLGSLFVRGALPDWRAFDAPFNRLAVRVPHYPFQRKRFWLREPATAVAPGPRPVCADEGEHPLLGPRRPSPSKQAEFECRLDAARTPVLLQHCVAGVTVVPASAFIEVALAAARATFGSAPARVEQVALRSALTLEETAPVDVLLIVTPAGETDAGFEVFSRVRSGEGWTSHVAGRLVRGGSAGLPSEEDPTTVASEAVDLSAYRQRMADVGLEYGPSFSALVAAWCGDGVAVGELRLPMDDQLWERCAVHPGLLDAAFHLIGLALPASGTDVFYLPVRFESASVPVRVGREARAVARVRATGPSHAVADVSLWCADGQPAGYVRGLEVRAVSSHQFRAAIAHSQPDMLRLAWRRIDPGPTPAGRRETWRVLGGDAVFAEAVVQALRARGADAARVDQAAPDAFMAALVAGEARDVTAFIDLRSTVLTPALRPDTVGPAIEDLCVEVSGVLDLLKAVAASRLSQRPRIVLATVAAQATRFGEAASPHAAALWGAAVSAGAELPGLDLCLVDLDSPTPDAGTLVDAVGAADRESRLALRDGVVHGLRLTKVSAPDDQALLVPDAPYAIEIRERTLSGLSIQPCGRRIPAAGQIEVEVLASGVNFRDVLLLLGMYPGPDSAPGNECCGRVLSVGPGVDAPQPGDLVACIAESTFSSHVVCDAALAFRVPSELSLAQAAAFPIAHLTAYLALHRVGGIKAGDRVLIHAAAGGVGLAAVHLALAAGAEVLASAGSDEKRDYLRRLGVSHVFDSRRPPTASAIREATGGYGVDLLLNSLTGDAIPEGLRSLAPGGKFLEIGLREVWAPERARALRGDVGYHPLLLGDLCRRDSKAVRAMYDDVLALLRAGRIPPPRVRTYPVAHVSAAFSDLAKACHIGRLAVVHRPVQLAARPDATYLVTGGLGALGLHVAEWLARRGAGYLVLMGRSEPSADAARRIEDLRAGGVHVDVARGDVASPVAVRRVVDAVRFPLRGVIHAAGIVDDALLPDVDAPRLAAALRPKAAGAWNLAAATMNADLDLFVLFSSASAVLGAPGQTAYTAANAFMDALAHGLRAAGRPALSVNWGAWAGAGMAARVDVRTTRSWTARGIGTMSADAGLRALDGALESGLSQVVVLPIDWVKFFAALPSTPALFGELAPRELRGEPEAPRLSLREMLAARAPRDRADAIQQFVRAQAAAVLGVDVMEVDVRAGLTEQGLDSLMAVEFANRLAQQSGISVPSTFVFEYPTLVAVVSYLMDVLDLRDTDHPGHHVAHERPSVESDTTVAEMTPDAVSAALLNELDNTGY